MNVNEIKAKRGEIAASMRVQAKALDDARSKLHSAHEKLFLAVELAVYAYNKTVGPLALEARKLVEEIEDLNGRALDLCVEATASLDQPGVHDETVNAWDSWQPAHVPHIDTTPMKDPENLDPSEGAKAQGSMVYRTFEALPLPEEEVKP